MTDPIAARIVQPLVDALRLDPRATAHRLADMLVLAAVTTSVVNVATLDHRVFTGIWFAEAVHVGAAFVIRHVARRWADQGEAAAYGPEAGFHLMARLMLLGRLLFCAYTLWRLVASPIAHMVPVSVFRDGLDVAESLVALAAVYVGMCRMPPPRRRRERAAARAT